MKTKTSFFKSKSVSFIIIAACVAIVVVMVLSLFLTTYTSFSSGMSGAVNTQTRELSTQIVYNYENYIGSMIKTSNTIQTTIEKYNLDDFEDALDLSGFFQQIISLNSDILKISVYEKDNGRVLASTETGEIGTALQGGDIQWFTEAKEEPTVHAFSVPYAEYGSEEYKLSVSKSIKVKGAGEGAILKIEVSFQQFIDLVKKSNLGAGGHITIIDQNYEIVYTSTIDPPPQEETEVIREITLGSRNVEIGAYNMFVNVGTISNTKWRICVFINADRLTEIERSFLTTTILLSALILAISVGLFLAVARTITTPMKQLELTMRKVEKSDYFRMEEVDISASKEIEELTKRFNKMMRKISELMKRVIDEQNAQRKSELKALQNQINPHFLYNTLDSIVWLVENEKNAEASEMVVALARLFRLSISKETETIPVREEIEHVRNYLLIQSIRYADSFDYEIDVAEEALEISTMKLILQPIVENCLYHGLKNNIDRGNIKISAYLDDGYLVLSVADNGYGMRQETIDNLYLSFEDRIASNSVGLKNIYQRVMIYFGGNAQMKIESELDEGTTITIKEPLCR
jgi:Predicted signal transduction protein with a C-terminal ATPase domain